MPYFPHTDEERKKMAAAVGVADVRQLFGHLPKKLLCGPLNLAPGLSEMETAAELQRLAAANAGAGVNGPVCFLGAGAYDHFIPAAVDELSGRGEFYTAYTPYQPEISQGALQAIYEYQTMLASLCGADATNAGMYDGATAMAEACTAAVANARDDRNVVVLDGTLHPHYLRAAQTLLTPRGIRVEVVPPTADTYLSATDALIRAAAGPEIAAVVVGYPNFYGAVSPLRSMADAVHQNNALLIACSSPFLFGVLEPPGAQGADFVCGDAQPFGGPLSCGGPYLGYLACRKDLVRRLPGRLVGRTTDDQGRQAFTLTLQAREQHIRREKAASNICSNQALCAIRAWIHLSCLGVSGLRQANELALSRTAALRAGLRRLAASAQSPVAGVPEYAAGIEFVYETRRPVAAVLAQLRARGILGGVDLGRFEAARAHQILVCVTEKRTTDEINAYLSALTAG
jgi:glycine dehydrogenase subunit 1